MNKMNDQELQCYSQIIDCFQNSKNDINKKKLNKNKSIIALIKKSKCRNDKRFVQNALLLVLSLYEKDLPADYFENRGCDAGECNDEQKEELIADLKKEIPNLF